MTVSPNRLAQALAAQEAARRETTCETCAKMLTPDSLWMSGEACYCSASCRKDGQLAAQGDAVERNEITRWGEDHEARMARLKAAADDDMELLREGTLWVA